MRKILLGFAPLLLVSCDIGKLILETDEWTPPPEPAAIASPLPREACDHSAPERRALFGDLHLHTALSMDAYALGTRTSPDDAYAFARGRPIPIYGGAGGETGKTIHIDRPLDFAAVTDHAEWMAEVSPLYRPRFTVLQQHRLRDLSRRGRVTTGDASGSKGIQGAHCGTY